MRKAVLILGIVLAFSTSAMAVDIAISTKAGWWGQAAADQEMQDIVKNVKGASVQVFTVTELNALADWIVAHTGDGAADLLIMCGNFPETIYRSGNAQPEGSLAELFLDDGNTIINTGDYIFYVGTTANNDAGGLQNMMDLPTIAMWGDAALPCVPTAEGREITPSLPTIPSTRPFFFAQLTGDWYPELILAQSANGTVGDPVIVRNSVTGGRLGIFFQVADVLTDRRGEVISEWINNWYLKVAASGEVASSPSPADEATDVPLDTVLGWSAGKLAATHDVYLGTAFADVNSASRTDAKGVLVSQDQTAAEFDPAALEFGQTYYWRIDEVNGAPDNTIFKGTVWSFTAEPFTYAVTPIAAKASSAQPGMGPQNTINGSGLVGDEHSATETHMWMSAGVKPNWIQYDFDKVYKLDELWVWNSNQLIESFLGFGAKGVTIEYSLDGAAWTALEGPFQFARGPGALAYKANTVVDLGGITAQYVKLTINSNWGGMAPQTGLSEVRFFYVPVQAFQPEPAVGATGVSVETELAWRPGREATSHKVYVGVDEAAVTAGSVAAETVTDHSLTPTGLLLGTKYFWKVDELGDAGAYAGTVWNFTTEQSILVEGFESYNDEEGNRIYESWLDGLTDQASGSQVGYNQAPFAERTVVHGGLQAMPLMYDNTSFAFSEAKLTFDSPQNWTARNIKSLSLWFQGVAGNTGKLYVKIGDVKVVYDGEAADLAKASWQVWNINLSKVSKVNSVKSLTIGIEGAGAKGTLYVDDIRLYPKAPEFTTPVAPDGASLIARYTFNGDVKDSSGKGRNGTANGGPTFVAGVDGQAIHLDGTDDFVVVGAVGVSGAAPRTISGWVKADTTAITDWTNIFGFTSTPAAGNFLSFDMNKRGGANQYCIHAYGWEQNIMAIDLEWHHLAATYDGTTIVWYGDGQRVASEARALATVDNVQMGKRGHAAGGNFPGSVDEVRIYNKALSPEEIAWLAGKTLPMHKPL